MANRWAYLSRGWANISSSSHPLDRTLCCSCKVAVGSTSTVSPELTIGERLVSIGSSALALDRCRLLDRFDGAFQSKRICPSHSSVGCWWAFPLVGRLTMGHPRWDGYHAFGRRLEQGIGTFLNPFIFMIITKRKLPLSFLSRSVPSSPQTSQVALDRSQASLIMPLVFSV